MRIDRDNLQSSDNSRADQGQELKAIGGCAESFGTTTP
jgi:hypothetical protein